MNVRSAWAVALLVLAAACGNETTGGEAESSVDATVTAAVSGNQPFGSVLQMTSDNTLYSSADYHSRVLRTLSKGSQVLLVRSDPVSGLYDVNCNGTVGWATGSLMKVVSTPSGNIENATARAASSRGFSYRWGGESWDPTSQSPGSCTGDCPDCDHSGSWGADCSGMVAKAWKVRDCTSLKSECGRPTASAFSKTDPDGEWKSISRDSINQGDALASSGHVVYYVKGDAWGQPSVFECKGCADGCVYDSRSFSSSYKTSRRKW